MQRAAVKQGVCFSLGEQKSTLLVAIAIDCHSVWLSRWAQLSQVRQEVAHKSVADNEGIGYSSRDQGMQHNLQHN